MISPARSAAFDVLLKVHRGGYASDLLRAETGLDTRDAALAETIVFGCLRYQAQLDYLIVHYSDARNRSSISKSGSRCGSDLSARYLERIPRACGGRGER